MNSNSNTIAGVIVACMLVLSLAACSAADSSGNYDEPSDVEVAEESTEDDIVSDEEDSDVNIEEEQPAEPVEDVVYYDELPILEGYDFHEGYAWVVDKNMNSYLINTNGEAVYFTSSTSSYAHDEFVLYPVENGIAWIMYIPDSGSVDVYESCWIVVVDIEGNELYDGADDPFGEDVNEVCYGDGKLILCQHVENFDENKYLVGAGDLSGNIVSDFPDVRTPQYAYYLGEGVFWGRASLELADSESFVYDSRANVLNVFLADRDGPFYSPAGSWTFENGKILCSNTSGDYAMIDRATMVSSDFEVYNPPELGLHGSEYVGDNIISGENRGYYYCDMTTDEVFTIDTEGHSSVFSRFHNGIVSVVLEGKDEQEYVTMYDKTGKRLFAPFQIPYSIGLGDYILTGETLTVEGTYLHNTNLMNTLIDKNEKNIPIMTTEGASAAVHCVTNANRIAGSSERGYEFVATDSGPSLMSSRFNARYYFSEELLPVQYEGSGAYLGTDGVLKITSIKVPQSENYED